MGEGLFGKTAVGTGIGGSGEIRTHDTVSRMSLFESDAFNLSATLPSSFFKYPAIIQK